mgnify:CR=1 FL=1|jgi:hypothetical protein
MIPHWDAEAGNPIHQFVPESERPFQKSTSDFFEASTTGQGRTREERLLNLSRQRTPLCLAGAMSLRKREHSPESMIRKRAGFVNPVVVPDVFHEKVKTAIDNKYAYNMATRSKELLPREWVPPREPEFRKEAEIEPGMHDFVLRPKALPLENKHGLSVFNSKPKYIDEKRRANEEKINALQKFLAADKPQDWQKYHELEPKKVPLAQHFPDAHNKVTGPAKAASQFLAKDKW